MSMSIFVQAMQEYCKGPLLVGSCLYNNVLAQINFEHGVDILKIHKILLPFMNAIQELGVSVIRTIFFFT